MLLRRFLICGSIFTITIFTFVSCVIWVDYIPVSSDNYNVQNKKIIYTNYLFSLEIKGKYGRPQIYDIATKFDVSLINKNDSLKFQFRKVKLIAKDLQKEFYFSDFITEGGRKKQGEITIPPGKKIDFQLLFSIYLQKF